MGRQEFLMRRVQGLRQWLQVYLLYRRAFPRCERKPFSMIVSMHRRGKTDVWLANKDGHFAGFATTINSDKLVLLDYLSVPGKQRGRGCGSAMLNHMKQAYDGQGLLVEIEDAFAPGKDLEARMRRREFYLKNGMVSQRVMACVFGVNMELLAWRCSVDFAAYCAFYRDNYSEFAAGHIVEAVFPGEEE